MLAPRVIKNNVISSSESSETSESDSNVSSTGDATKSGSRFHKLSSSEDEDPLIPSSSQPVEVRDTNSGIADYRAFSTTGVKSLSVGQVPMQNAVKSRVAVESEVSDSDEWSSDLDEPKKPVRRAPGKRRNL